MDGEGGKEVRRLTVIRASVAYIASGIFVYLLGSFLVMEPNPFYWTELGRAVFLWLHNFIAALLIAVLLGMDKRDDQR